MSTAKSPLILCSASFFLLCFYLALVCHNAAILYNQSRAARAVLELEYLPPAGRSSGRSSLGTKQDEEQKFLVRRSDGRAGAAARIEQDGSTSHHLPVRQLGELHGFGSGTSHPTAVRHELLRPPEDMAASTTREDATSTVHDLHVNPKFYEFLQIRSAEDAKRRHAETAAVAAQAVYVDVFPFLVMAAVCGVLAVTHRMSRFAHLLALAGSAVLAGGVIKAAFILYRGALQQMIAPTSSTEPFARITEYNVAQVLLLPPLLGNQGEYDKTLELGRLAFRGVCTNHIYATPIFVFVLTFCVIIHELKCRRWSENCRAVVFAVPVTAFSGICVYFKIHEFNTVALAVVFPWLLYESESLEEYILAACNAFLEGEATQFYCRSKLMRKDELVGKSHVGQHSPNIEDEVSDSDNEYDKMKVRPGNNVRLLHSGTKVVPNCGLGGKRFESVENYRIKRGRSNDSVTILAQSQQVVPGSGQTSTSSANLRRGGHNLHKTNTRTTTAESNSNRTKMKTSASGSSISDLLEHSRKSSLLHRTSSTSLHGRTSSAYKTSVDRLLTETIFPLEQETAKPYFRNSWTTNQSSSWEKQKEQANEKVRHRRYSAVAVSKMQHQQTSTASQHAAGLLHLNRDDEMYEHDAEFLASRAHSYMSTLPRGSFQSSVRRSRTSERESSYQEPDNNCPAMLLEQDHFETLRGGGEELICNRKNKANKMSRKRKSKYKAGPGLLHHSDRSDDSSEQESCRRHLDLEDLTSRLSEQTVLSSPLFSAPGGGASSLAAPSTGFGKGSATGGTRESSPKEVSSGGLWAPSANSSSKTRFVQAGNGGGNANAGANGRLALVLAESGTINVTAGVLDGAAQTTSSSGTVASASTAVAPPPAFSNSTAPTGSHLPGNLVPAPVLPQAQENNNPVPQSGTVGTAPLTAEGAEKLHRANSNASLRPQLQAVSEEEFEDSLGASTGAATVVDHRRLSISSSTSNLGATTSSHLVHRASSRGPVHVAGTSRAAAIASVNIGNNVNATLARFNGKGAYANTGATIATTPACFPNEIIQQGSSCSANPTSVYRDASGIRSNSASPFSVSMDEDHGKPRTSCLVEHRSSEEAVFSTVEKNIPLGEPSAASTAKDEANKLMGKQEQISAPLVTTAFQSVVAPAGVADVDKSAQQGSGGKASTFNLQQNTDEEIKTFGVLAEGEVRAVVNKPKNEDSTPKFGTFSPASAAARLASVGTNNAEDTSDDSREQDPMACFETAVRDEAQRRQTLQMMA
ncbi:unnamed protein product [Amoebophrya sp. A120]|nr:unnamed protein product [Amoebophrya sp. A120]|eukprot:GSA120T00002768001.1